MSIAVLKSETFIGETVWFKEVLQQWWAVLLPVKPREIGDQNHLNVLHQQKSNYWIAFHTALGKAKAQKWLQDRDLR